MNGLTLRTCPCSLQGLLLLLLLLLLGSRSCPTAENLAQRLQPRLLGLRFWLGPACDGRGSRQHM